MFQGQCCGYFRGLRTGFLGGFTSEIPGLHSVAEWRVIVAMFIVIFLYLFLVCLFLILCVILTMIALTTIITLIVFLLLLLNMS